MSRNERTLYVVMGLPGTGKTFVARSIAHKLGAFHLRTDVIRKELFSTPIYSENEKEVVYKEFFRRATEVLERESSVVLDATFAKRIYRDGAEKVAKQAGAKLVLLETMCPENIVRERLASRMHDESDATFTQYLAQKDVFESLIKPHCSIDTSKKLDAQLCFLFD